MPRYSIDTCPTTTKQQNNRERKVGYFKLGPNEKAIVRFAYASAREIEIATVHEVKVKDRFRTVLCIRDAKEPLDACPLCANGTPIKSRAYVKLLRYELDEQGKVANVFAEVANWPKKYADTLAVRNNEYGDLQDSLFIVTRMGTGKETSYDISYANPMKYNEANGFVKDFSDFEDFELAHHSYMERSKEDIEEFLQSGEFPFKKKEESTDVSQQQVVNTVPAVENVQGPVTTNPRFGTTPQPVELTPTPKIGDPVTPTTTNVNVNPQVGQSTGVNSNEFIQRPRRTYDIK